MNASLKGIEEAAHAVENAYAPWEELVEAARKTIGADAMTFMIFDNSTRSLHALVQRGLGETVESEYCNHYQHLDAMVAVGLKSEPGTWIDSAKHVDWSDHAEYVDFLERSKIGQVIALVLGQCGSYFAAFSLQRQSQSSGTYGSLDGMDLIGCRIRDAFLKRMHLANANASLIRDAVEDDTTCFATVSLAGKIEFSSENMGRVLRGGEALAVKSKRLSHSVDYWNEKLLYSLRTSLGERRTVHITVPSSWGRFFKIKISPIQATATIGVKDLLSVLIERSDVFDIPSSKELKEAFQLTNAEARIYALLASGGRIGDGVRSLGVSESTLRKQISSVMRKTGCESQTELIRLCSKL
jgi:DNA-binding CsgD family transcriptional regulator